jgi:hypothetical protein
MQIKPRNNVYKCALIYVLTFVDFQLSIKVIKIANMGILPDTTQKSYKALADNYHILVPTLNLLQ